MRHACPKYLFDALHQEGGRRKATHHQHRLAAVGHAAQLRVDEQSLRRKQMDVLPRLLAEMEAQRARLLLEA